MATHRVEYTSDGKARKTLTGFIENYYPNLIEPSLFYKVIDVMSNRKQKNWSGRRTEQDYNIFKHCIFCEQCGGKLYYDHRGSRYKEKIYPFFKCDNARIQKHICSADNIRFEYVLGSLLECIYLINRVARDITRDFKNISTQARYLNPRIHNLLKIDDSKRQLTLDEKQSELVARRTKLDNMTARMIEADYNVPKSYLNQMKLIEAEVEDLKKEIDILDSRMHESIYIEDTQTIIDLFRTDEGRSKLNSFFKSNEIAFYVAHSKITKKTVFRMHRKNSDIDEKITGTTSVFPLKNILQKYGIEDLQTMFNLTVS